MKKAKRLLSLVMAMAMVFALAVSASAVEEGETYTLSLENTGAPHSVSIFDGYADVENADSTSTITVSMKSLSVYDSSSKTVVSGYVSDVTCNTSGYTATIVGATGTSNPGELVITCPSSVTASAFCANITFTITAYKTDGTTYQHSQVTGDVKFATT